MARRRHRARFDLMADVNVVSLIDVMLLLLVIFMITAPMMQGGLDITLPTADAKPLESKEETISFSKEQQWALDFGTQLAGAQTLRDSLRVAVSRLSRRASTAPHCR